MRYVGEYNHCVKVIEAENFEEAKRKMYHIATGFNSETEISIQPVFSDEALDVIGKLRESITEFNQTTGQVERDFALGSILARAENVSKLLEAM